MREIGVKFKMFHLRSWKSLSATYLVAFFSFFFFFFFFRVCFPVSFYCESPLAFVFPHIMVPFVQIKNVKNTHVVVLLKLLQPATLLKVKILHGCFHVFEIVQMVPNRAIRLM